METFWNFWVDATKYISLRYFIIAGVAYLLFYWILKNRIVQSKVQQTFPKRSHIIYEVLFSVQTMLIFGIIATLVLSTFRSYTLIYDDISLFGWNYYIATFPLMFILHDTYFYWMHRAMHHPKLFRYVHKVHHHSTNPTPWASYSFHFTESILEAMIIPLIAFTFPVHFTALVLFLLLQFVYNVYGHLGWELYPRWFHKTWLGKYVNTSLAHNMHHKYFNGNYGLYFLFWDRVMGTLRDDYDEVFEKGRKLS